MAVKSHIKNYLVLECYKIIFFPSSFSPCTVVNSVDLEELLSVLFRPQKQGRWNRGGARGQSTLPLPPFLQKIIVWIFARICPPPPSLPLRVLSSCRGSRRRTGLNHQPVYVRFRTARTQIRSLVTHHQEAARYKPCDYYYTTD